MVYSVLSTNVYKGLQQYNYNNSCTHPSLLTLPSAVQVANTVEAKGTHSTSQTEVKGEHAEMSWPGMHNYVLVYTGLLAGHTPGVHPTRQKVL